MRQQSIGNQLRPDQFYLEGVQVDALSLKEATARVCDELDCGSSFSVFTLNLDHIVKLKSNRLFRGAYNRARIVLPDGFPIALLGRLQGRSVARTTGADLIEPLCAEASRRGLAVALVGSSWSTLHKAAKYLHAQDRNLNIAGVYAPAEKFDVKSDAAIEAIAFVRDSGARVCFVALGAPKQEVFSDRCAGLVEGVAFVCIGAGLDFLAGTQRRAPMLFRKLGMEWMWRVVLDPRRLGRRYLHCLLVLPSLLFDGYTHRRKMPSSQ